MSLLAGINQSQVGEEYYNNLLNGSGGVAGVTSITADGGDDLMDTVNFQSGTNVTLTNVGNTIIINASTGGGGVTGISANGGSTKTGLITLSPGTGMQVGSLGNQVLFTNVGVCGINGGGLSNITGGSAGVGFLPGSNATITAIGGATPALTIGVAGSPVFSNMTVNTASFITLSATTANIGTANISNIVAGNQTFTNINVTNTLSTGALDVRGQAVFENNIITNAGIYRQRQSQAVNGSNQIIFSNIQVPEGTYICAVRGSDQVSYYSATVGLWGDVDTGQGQGVTKIAASSNVNSVSPAPLSFNYVDDGDGFWIFTPVFTSTLVNSVSSFLCTISPNFG
jgi:hypothetical protein